MLKRTNEASIRSFDDVPRIRAVDLFCGAGGLTYGLEAAGIDVRMGVDIDSECQFPYNANNKAKFNLKSVQRLTGDEVRAALWGAKFKLIAGCAPCQPFSTYSQARRDTKDERWNLLDDFARLIVKSNANLVTMENVPKLAEERVFARFVKVLETRGFKHHHQVVDCSDYGVPQQRKRLVLLASRLGPIRLEAPRCSKRTVWQAIGKLPLLAAGEDCPSDPLHIACALSPINLERIRASRPGGSWRDWPEHLIADCHRKNTGRGYASVYGRMVWDEPSPTITTQFYGFGSGRFGHPEQDRGLSLREGAMLQGFPKHYKFVEPGVPIRRKQIGRLIGNAVPVGLAKAIGQTIVNHVREHVGVNA